MVEKYKVFFNEIMEELLNVFVEEEHQDEDIEEAVLFHLINNRVGRRRNIYDRLNLQLMLLHDIESNFRFEREHIVFLAERLRLPAVIRTRTRNVVSGVEGLCILLRRLAYPNRLKDLEKIFGLSAQSISQISNKLATLILSNFGHILENLDNVLWLNRERLITYSQVAIKVMDVNQIKEDYVIRNLYREAKILSKLNHPCIVALFQTMQRSDNIYYLVTELVSGGDLCTFVKSQHEGRLEERPTRMFGRQFASALAHMHGLGVVHRDLKMENVMLNSSRQQIKIVDFGLSNVWSVSDPLRTHCGSPEYAAPELFVTGKQYGAEVDLWSLGIILYGMVLGQLPFVTSRCSQVTSQERRKKLVAQINRGLASSHRRALASFSSEFRSLINRLLVADASKRITVKELLVHPWLTEKGRKMIRTNPFKSLDPALRNKIVNEVSAVLQKDPNIVQASIAQDPLGKIGGMFNVLQRRQQMNQISGDGVTRNLPSLTLLELSDLTKNIGKEKKISTTRSSSQKKPHTAMSTRKSDFCTPRIIGLEKALKPVKSSPNEKIAINKPQQQPKPKKKDQQQPKTRPSTVQATTKGQTNRPTMDYRLIKSPSLRRKVYSATITPKTNRTYSPGDDDMVRVRPTSPSEDMISRGQVSRPAESDGKGLKQKKEGMEVAHVNGDRKARLYLGSRQVVAQESRVDHSKIRQTVTEDVRCRSEQSHSRKRPVTGALQQILERSLKSAGVTLSQSITKASEKPQRNVRNCVVHNQESYTKHWERSPLAFGDNGIRAVTAPYSQGRKPAIYDPIAKSIADYVANNVPEKLHRFPWFRK